MGNDAITPGITSQPDAQTAKLVDAADLDSRTVQSADPSEGVVRDEVSHDVHDFTKTEVDDYTAALDARLQDMALEPLLEDIVTRWRKTAEDLGPYFYHARRKMNSQGVRNDILRAEGKPEEGFSAWCDQHEIPRSTANLWADRYAVRIGAKPKPGPGPSTASGAQPPTEESTSSNVGQGAASDAGDFSTAIGGVEEALSLLSLCGLQRPPGPVGTRCMGCSDGVQHNLGDRARRCRNLDQRWTKLTSLAPA